MKKIFVFGIGIGYKKLKDFINYNNYEILGFIDNNKDKQGTEFEEKMIFSPEDAIKMEFEYILIASIFYDEIEDQLIKLGVDASKIIKYYSSEDKIFDPRIVSLKLIQKEIIDKNLQGNVAELGVYKGEFAKYINEVFCDRTLYLFDTFEGFNEKDLEIEHSNKFSLANKEDFTNTNENMVLNKMKYKDKCIIKKGYFPDSLNGLEDKFVFVSLDVDLYKPTYEGLKYFYDRLVKGGYIFVHDYNNISYKGVKEAVRKFVEERDISYFPLNDSYGSVILIK